MADLANKDHTSSNGHDGFKGTLPLARSWQPWGTTSAIQLGVPLLGKKT